MDELIARVSAAIGVDAKTAESAIGHVLAFLQNASPDLVADLMGKLPGAAEAAIAARESELDSGMGGMLGGLMGAGLMGLAARLNGLGLDMGQIRTLAKELFATAEGIVGRENVEQIAASIPGLSQFI